MLVSLLPALVYAQVDQRKRFEIELNNDEPSYQVTTAAVNGLVLFRHLAVDSEDKLELVRLDTSLQYLWKGYLSVGRPSQLISKKTSDEKIYFLFRPLDATVKDFDLFVIQQDDGKYVQYTIKSIIRFLPTEFQVTQEAVLIGGYFNNVPLVLHYDFSTGRSRVLPGLFNEAGELTQIKVYPEGDFDVLISARNIERQKTIWVKSYYKDGSLISNYALVPEDNKNFLFGRTVNTKNMKIIAGVYGNRQSEYSRGLFIATIDPSGVQQTRYYNFGDLENFFKYMRAKRETRIKERIERRKIKGKKIKFNYRFLVHEIIEKDGQYILLGEAFYPRYITMDGAYGGFFMPYSFYSRSAIQNGRIFDGYRYTHAVVIGFDRDGKLLWDNSFEINDVKSYTLEQFVKLDIEDDKIGLLYLFENEIRTKIIRDNEVLEGKSREFIKTFYAEDMATNIDTEKSKLEYWYDGFFYAFGEQFIVNIQTAGIKPKRRVFFNNKISYE